MREKNDLVLSPAQQRLWFLEQLAPGSPQYNVFQAYELRGRLDVEALRRALGALVDRHEALRMNFPAEAGRPTVVLREPPCTVELPLTDRTADGDEAVSEFASRWADEPFDIAADPLLRAHLVRTGPERHILLLGVHHIVIDGWSSPILDEELAALYPAEVTGGPSGLAPHKADYTDYARWRHDRSQSPDAERDLQYWRERLAGAPALITLPTDRPRPRIQEFTGADLTVPLPPEVVAGLARLGRANRATPFMVALTAFTMLLARHARTEDVVVGIVEAGRSRPEFSSTIGFFVETLPIRVDLSGDPSYLTALAATREALFGAYEHNLLSFDMLVDRLHVERDLSYTPLVQVIFQLLYLPSYGATMHWHDLDVRRWGEEVKQTATRFDLEVHMMEDGKGGLDLGVCYSVELFDQATIQELFDTYITLLTAVCEDPDLPWSALRARIAGRTGTVRVSVRDDEGVPLPRGVLGELWLEDAEAGTGLLARIRADGTVEHHGSYDSELTVRGTRVPARLIEDTLAEDPAVATAHVRNDPSGPGLVATLSLVPGHARPSTVELRRRLRKRLPSFLVPGSFKWEQRAEEAAPDEPVVFVLAQDQLVDRRGDGQ